MNPVNCMTFNSSLPTIYPINIQASTTYLESTALILAYGFDLYFVKTSPSQNFDMLAPDFNYGLLILILIGMASALYMIRNISKMKTLKGAWK